MAGKTIRLRPGEAAIVVRADESWEAFHCGDDDDVVEYADVAVATLGTLLDDEPLFSALWDRTVCALTGEEPGALN